jgi:curved DNA-binding protein CbpA
VNSAVPRFIDYYQVLHVRPDADQSALRQAYVVLAKKYHPDVGGMTAEMKLVNEAYRTLRSPQARADYNERYRQHATWRRGGGEEYDDIDELFGEVIRETKLKKDAEARARKAALRTIVIGAAVMVALIAGGVVMTRLFHRAPSGASHIAQ